MSPRHRGGPLGGALGIAALLGALLALSAVPPESAASAPKTLASILRPVPSDLRVLGRALSPGEQRSAALASRLRKGKFLVARHQLWDPNFSQTVVLLIEHGPQGALGVIVNRPSKMRLSALLPEIEGIGERPDSLYLGGPVAVGRMLMLVRATSGPEGTHHVFEDVHAGSSRELLERLIGEGFPPERLRVYAGHAGWAPGQLEREVARDDWLILPGDAGAVFDAAPAEVWPRLIERDSDLLAELHVGIDSQP